MHVVRASKGILIWEEAMTKLTGFGTFAALPDEQLSEKISRRSQANKHRAQRVRSLQAVHLRADDPKSTREEQRCRSGGTSVKDL